MFLRRKRSRSCPDLTVRPGLLTEGGRTGGRGRTVHKAVEYRGRGLFLQIRSRVSFLSRKYMFNFKDPGEDTPFRARFSQGCLKLVLIRQP